MADIFQGLPDLNTEAKIPNNIEVTTDMFSDLLPDEEKYKFKLTTEGNRGSNLSDKDKTEPGLFDDLPDIKSVESKKQSDIFDGLKLPEENKKNSGYLKALMALSPLTSIGEKTENLVNDIDEDSTNLKKIAYAAQLGFFDTYRGAKQITGIDTEKMKADQKKLYEFMENEDGSTNYGVAAAYFGGAILDPAGWLLPITKAKTLYAAAKYGFVNSGIIGALGYVDEESILDTRAKQAGASAIGGTILGPVITGVTKKIKGEKVFTRENIGIPGFDSPSIKVGADSELQKIKLQNEAGLKDRNVVARKKIEIDDSELIKDMPTDRSKLLRGPKLWFRENVVKAWENKVGKKTLNYLTNGEYGAEAGAAGTGAVIGYASGDEDTPITTKFSRAFTGALLGAGGIKGARMKTFTKTFGKGEDKTEEVTESLLDFLGRQFVDGYGLPKNFKGLKAEADGFANSMGSKFTYMAQKIQKNLTPDEQKILINLLEGDIKLKVAPAKLQELSQQSRKLINEMAQDYIDMGLITKETFNRNKNIYIKRSYRGKLENRPFAEELKHRGATQKTTIKEFDEVYKGQQAYTTTSQKVSKDGIFKEAEGKKKLIKGHRGWEILESSKAEMQNITDKYNNKIKLTRNKKKKAQLISDKKKELDEMQINIRWDYTKPQRVGLGEIEDAAYAIAETGRAGSATLSQYRLFDSISKQGYVFDTFAKVPKDLKAVYKQIPTTSLGKTGGKLRYGNLAGKYVPDEVYKNLIATNAYYRKSNFLKGYRSLNSYWKVSKTAWNPTVHVNNVVSNVMLHDLVDADFKYLLPAWKALMKHNKANKAGKMQKSELVEIATRYGVFDVDLVSTELKNIQAASSAKFPYTMDESVDAFNNSVSMARNVFKDSVVNGKLGLTKMTDWYRFEDSVFRLSVFQDRLSKGWKVQDAALDARKSFIDYNIDAPAINWMRNTVTPFLAYTYRIIPILAETAIVRPWKYAKYAALGYGLNKLGDTVGGGDEDAERAVMPERKSGRFLNMGFLPFRNIKIPVSPDKNGNPLYMDFTRFVPGGDIMDLNGTLPGVPAPLQPSGGLAGEILFPLAGYDLFKQQEIKGLTGNYSEDWNVKLKAIASKLIPNIPFVPGTYSTEKIKSTRLGMESGFRPDQTEFTALAQSLGFKIERADISKLTAGKVFELKREITGYKEQISELRKRYTKGLINQETFTTKAEAIAEKIKLVAAKYQVKFDKATYADTKEPFEDIKNLFEGKN